MPLRDRSLPPVVFHWFPFIGSAIWYGNDPLGFFFENREKARVPSYFSAKFVVTQFEQYGDVFTFNLFGRKVTVALGAQGNNFVLGGKSAALSAEDAYNVSTFSVTFSPFKINNSPALDYTGIWEGCSI